MKVKSYRKLAVQIISVIIPVMIVMVVLILNTVYKSTVSGFLKAQNTLMSERLNASDVNLMFEEQICEVSEWYFDYIELHPEVLTEPITDVEKEYVAGNAPDGSTFSLFWDIDFVMKSDDIVQKFCTKDFLRFIRETTEEQNEANRFDCVFMVLAPQNGSRGPVIFRSINGESEEAFDEITMIDIPNVIKNRKAVSDDDVIFMSSRDFMLEGDYYIGYRPMYINGEVRAVIGVAYDWSDFSKVMLSTYKKTVLLGIGALLIALAVLVFVIYKEAIKPVEVMKESILEYTVTNDSDKVKKRMSDIRVRNELGVLADAFSDMTIEIDHHIDENVKLMVEKERISAELDLATNIQASQLPNVFPPFPDRHEFDIYASMTPAKEVGGDFYDFFFVDDDHLALVIADVSGKGVPAALFMMMSKMLISNYTMTGISPSEVMNRTNKELCRNNKNQMFVTAWLGILEISTGKLTFANAGHECPVIKQPEGKFEVLRTKHDFVLGGLKNKVYKQSEITLQKGAVLFLYTDGVPEATNSDNQMFRLERLTQVLNDNLDAAPMQLLDKVQRAVDEFVGNAPQFDDLTMLGIKLL